MSIGGIGSLGHDVSALLARLGGTQGASGVDSDGDFDGSTGSVPTATATAAASPGNGLTGSTKAAVSDQILALLTQLQQIASTQAGSPAVASTLIAATSAATSSATIAPASTTADPSQNSLPRSMATATVQSRSPSSKPISRGSAERRRRPMPYFRNSIRAERAISPRPNWPATCSRPRHRALAAVTTTITITARRPQQNSATSSPAPSTAMAMAASARANSRPS